MLGMTNPAERIIAKFGGPAVVAEITKRDISRVHRWTYPPEKGGSGGIIPPKAQDMLLAEAAARGIALTRDEFFHPVGEPLKKIPPQQLPSASKGSNAPSKKSAKDSASSEAA